jgi:hypothetical protein
MPTGPAAALPAMRLVMTSGRGVRRGKAVRFKPPSLAMGAEMSIEVQGVGREGD